MQSDVFLSAVILADDDEQESVPKEEEEESQSLSTESKPSNIDQIDSPAAESTTTKKSPKEPTNVKASHKNSSENHSGIVEKKPKKDSKSKTPATKKPKSVGLVIINTVPSQKRANGQCTLHWAKIGRWANIRGISITFISERAPRYVTHVSFII